MPLMGDDPVFREQGALTRGYPLSDEQYKAAIAWVLESHQTRSFDRPAFPTCKLAPMTQYQLEVVVDRIEMSWGTFYTATSMWRWYSHGTQVRLGVSPVFFHRWRT